MMRLHTRIRALEHREEASRGLVGAIMQPGESHDDAIARTHAERKGPPPMAIIVVPAKEPVTDSCSHQHSNTETSR